MTFKYSKKLMPYLPAFFMALSAGTIMVGVPFYAIHLGIGKSDAQLSFIIGLFGSLQLFVYILFAFVFGRAADRFSIKMPLYISSIFSATIYFFAPLCKSLKQFAVVFPLAGFSQAMFWPAKAQGGVCLNFAKSGRK